MKEFDILLSRLDHSHPFVESPSPSLLCSRCGKVRAVHADAGFHAGNPPSRFNDVPEHVRYRGAHPQWRGLRSVKVDKSEEYEIANASRHRAQADAIRKEEQRQIRIALGSYSDCTRIVLNK